MKDPAISCNLIWFYNIIFNEINQQETFISTRKHNKHIWTPHSSVYISFIPCEIVKRTHLTFKKTRTLWNTIKIKSRGVANKGTHSSSKLKTVVTTAQNISTQWLQVRSRPTWDTTIFSVRQYYKVTNDKQLIGHCSQYAILKFLWVAKCNMFSEFIKKSDGN